MISFAYINNITLVSRDHLFSNSNAPIVIGLLLLTVATEMLRGLTLNDNTTLGWNNNYDNFWLPTRLFLPPLSKQRREDSYGGGGGSSSDDNRSSGHASMSDGHTSSSPPVDTLPRHHDHHMRSPLKVGSVNDFV